MNILKNINSRLSFPLIKILAIFSTTLILGIGIGHDCFAFEVTEKKTVSPVDGQVKKKVIIRKRRIEPVAVKPAPQPQIKVEEYIEAPQPEIRIEPILLKREKISVSPQIVVRPIPTRLTREQINNYVEKLKHGETIDDKVDAAKKLGSTGIREYIYDPIIDKVYDALVGAFRENNDETLLESIASTLGKLGKEEAGKILIDYIKYNDESRVKSSAIGSLGRLRYHGAVDILIGILRYDNDPAIRSQSATALGMIKDSSAISALISALDDDDFYVTKAAINALGRIGSPEAEYPLKNILEYEDDLELREAAAGALRRIESAADSHR